MTLHTDMIFLLTCNYIPRALSQLFQSASSASCLHHCLKVNPDFVNSPRPILILSALPLSSFATNSPSIFQTVFARRDRANSAAHHISLGARIEHMVTSARRMVTVSLHSSPWNTSFFFFFFFKAIWSEPHNHCARNDINQSQSDYFPLMSHANSGLH